MKNLLMIKILIIAFILMPFSGCKWFTEAKPPALSFAQITVPVGTPKFQKGYKDGCGTVLYARGNILYRNIYKHNMDPSLIDDSEYMFGYKRGYSYCFQYAVGSGHFSGGADTYLYPKVPTPYTQGMTAGNINNVYNGYGALNWMNIPNGGLDGVVDAFSKNTHGQGGVFSAYPTWGTPNTGGNFTW